MLRVLPRARGLLTVALLALSVPVLTESARASSNGEWSLEPASAEGTTGQRAFFDYSLAPGNAVQDQARLANLTDRELTFDLYAADAFTTAEGGFALRLQDASRAGVGSWVSLTTSRLTVAAKTAVTFPIQIGVPADATPGDWAGGIVASVAAPAGSSGGGPGLAIEQGVAARIYVRVDGPLEPAFAVDGPHLDLPTVSWAPLVEPAAARIAYDLANTGNTRLSGAAHLEITDTGGRTVHAFPDRPFSDLLPGEHIALSETWDGASLTRLRYDARVVVTAGRLTVESTSRARWQVPVLVLPAFVVSLGLVALCARAGRRLVRRRRRRRAEAIGS